MPDPSPLAVTPDPSWPWYLAPSPAPAAPRLRDIWRSSGLARSDAEGAAYQAQYVNNDLDYYCRCYPLAPLPVVPKQCAPETLAWIRREQARAGEYLPVPALPAGTPDAYPEHFVHLARLQSPGDPPMVAYTPSDAYGRADRKIRVKPGRYLAQFYPDLPNDQRVAWADAVALSMAAAKLTITDDPDTIGQVYANGPNSCMGGKKADYFDLDQHPATVYGAPGDLAVAYLGPLAKPTARAILWPAKKWYGRAYGHETILTALLADAGYTANSNHWHGARLRRVESRGDYIMPYLDCGDTANVSDCGAFFIIARGNDGEVGCKNQNGRPEDCGGSHVCEHCQERYEDSDSDTYCQSCYDEYWTCDSCNDTFWSDDCRNGENGSYCDSCYRDMSTTCAHCDDTFVPDDMGYHARRAWQSHGLSDYCPDCAPDMATCDDCGDVVKADTCDADGHCESCHVEPENDDDSTPDDDSTDDSALDRAPDDNPADSTPEVK